MLDPNQGLRFDVYERVHLSDEVAAIDELEEIELTPHIEIIDQEEQVLLRGNLLLSGLYNSQQAGGTQLLEYWIPVEITLPMNRVHRLEDLAVDIDNFDVDLLSARTLSITGVLSLRGILGEEQSAYTEWEPTEEPFTVVHRAGQQPEEQQVDAVPRATDGHSRPYAPPESPLHAAPEPAAKRTRPQAGGPPGETQQPPKAVPAEATVIPEPARITEPIPVAESLAEPPQAAVARPAKAEAPPNTVEPATAKGMDTQQAPKAAPALSQAPETDIQPVSWTSFAEADEREKVLAPAQEDAIEAAESENVPEPFPEPLSAVQPEEALPVKQEMKIAFSGKRPESAESESGIGLKTLLSSSRKDQEARPQARPAEEAAPEPVAAANGDEVEWKRLFLSNTGEETEFRRIRMCIVQREETLEEIAERYQLGSREIVLYNRLPDHTVSEGQVLHIP